MYSIPQNTAEINTDRRITALEMARRGLYLLPLKPQSKAPYSELLQGNSWNSLKEYRATPAIVESWFKYDPEINIGIITGQEIEPGYKLIVVDIDKKPEAGLPVTPIVETSRGYHVYFKCRENQLPEPHKGPAGEIKINGYVVAPPGKHPDGHRYTWSEFLSFIDVKLADFNKRRTDIINILEEGTADTSFHTPVKEERELNTTINIYCSVKNGKGLTEGKSVSGDPEANKELFKGMIRDDKTVIKIMQRVFDVEVSRVGKAFKCPLHKENHPSAALYRTDSGDIGVKDFHRAGNFYTLPEFYYEARTGSSKKLEGATWLIWLIRLLRDSGLIEVPRIIPPKPVSKLSDNQERLYKAFIELLEVQQGYDPNQTGAPFSHRFAASWSGLKYESVRSAKRGLSKKKYIKKISPGDRETRKAGKWDLIK